MIPERLHQGQLELLLGPRMVLGSLADDPLLTRPDGSPMLDRGGVALYATSQGSILGGATVALSPDLERAVLNVPGMPLSLVLPRASLFDPFATLLESVVEAPHDAELLVPLMGMLWEPVEAAGYAPYITGAPLDPGLPEKRVLLQAAIGDASVTTLGAHIYARATGAGLVQPDNRPVWGLQPVELSLATGSALLEIDYGQTEPLEAIPAAEDGDPHGEPIRSEPIQDQAVHFLLTGEIIETCDGACDPD